MIFVWLSISRNTRWLICISYFFVAFWVLRFRVKTTKGRLAWSCGAWRSEQKKVPAWFMPFCKFTPCQTHYPILWFINPQNKQQQTLCFKNWCSQRHISRKDTRHHIKQIRQTSNVWNACRFQNCLRSIFVCSHFLFGFHFIVAWRNMFLVCAWSDKSTLRLIMTLPSSDSKSPKFQVSQKKSDRMTDRMFFAHDLTFEARWFNTAQ